MLGGLSGMTSLAMSYYMYVDNITHIRNAHTEKNRGKQFIYKQLAFESKYDPKTLVKCSSNHKLEIQTRKQSRRSRFFF